MAGGGLRFAVALTLRGRIAAKAVRNWPIQIIMLIFMRSDYLLTGCMNIITHF